MEHIHPKNMFHVEHYDEVSICPLCSSEDIKPFLTIQDHSISGEEFQIQECLRCTHRFTTPVPSVDIIGKYYASEDYISHSDTDQGFINRLYHRVRNISLKQKISLVKKHTPIQNALMDFGSGTGYFLDEANKHFKRVAGVEPEEKSRRICFDKFGLPPHSTMDDLDNETFDAITLWHVFEHLHDPEEKLVEFYNRLASSGSLIIAVPNCASRDARHYKSYWAAYDVPRHLHHFRKDSIIPFVKRKGFELESIAPMKFDSFYVSMLSEKYKGGSMMMAFIQGLLSNLSAIRSGEFSSLIYIFRKRRKI